MNYTVRKIFLQDPHEREDVVRLLHAEQLQLDPHIDCTYGIFHGDTLLATGSAYRNTLRCIAVRNDKQGEGLLPPLMSELIADRSTHGFFNLFIYTKCSAASFFETLGFYPIVSVADRLVFMENKKNGFASYLAALQKTADYTGNASAIVMNANPFTKGHAFLIERAAAVSDHVYLFMVSEDASVIPFSVRERLIRENTADIQNISYFRTGDYLISSATFPSYFLPDCDEAAELHAALDAALFIKIARNLHITHRFVGEEPFSRVTGIYNRILQQTLPKHGIQVEIIPRKESGGIPISASLARRYLQQENTRQLETILPPISLRFFQSTEGCAIIEKLKMLPNVIHH